MRVFFFTQVLLWFFWSSRAEEVQKEGGIRDARVEVHPVNWLTPEAQDPETRDAATFVFVLSQVLNTPVMQRTRREHKQRG